MSAVVDAIWQGLTGASWIEQTATILGLIAVWLATRQNLWNFPLGMVQVVLTALVFADQRLYADMSLQGVYFIALGYGWWCWAHPGARRHALPVTRLVFGQRIAIVTIGLVSTALWGTVLVELGDPMPWRDAFITSFGVLSQWLEAHKKIDAWVGWMIVNIAGLGVYIALDLYWFSVLYALYLILSLIGLRAWWLSYRARPAL